MLALNTIRRRHIVAVLGVALVLAGGAPHASAASYVVTACGARTSPGPERAWTASTTSGATLETSASCSGVGETQAGLSARDIDGHALDTPGGGRAEWSFTAPASTTIAALTASRYVGVYATDSFHAYLRDHTGAYLESCTPDQDPGLGCELGTANPAAATRTFSGLNTIRLAYGVVCTAGVGGVCANGATTNKAWATLYGATVTLTDDHEPQITASAGHLFSGSDSWRSGVVAGTVTASDVGGGVGRVDVLVDGVRVPAATVEVACDYTLTVPCPTAAADRAVALATASVPDGIHTLQARVTDATRDRVDANQALTDPVPLRIDNTPPAAPTVAPTGTVRAGEPFGVSWTAPDQGAGSPIADAHWELVSPTGAVQASGVTTGAAVTGLTVPTDGTWAVRVTLRDAAGPGTPGTRTFVTAAPESATVAPPPSPEPTTAAPEPSTLPSPPGALPSRSPMTAPRTATAAQRLARLADVRAVRGRAAVRVSGRALVAGRVRVTAAGRIVATMRVRADRPFVVRVRLPRGTHRVVVRHRTASGHAGRAVIVRIR